MTANNLLMQFLADVLDVPVVRPIVAETVSLGAAYAAGLAVGFWPDIDALRANWHKAAEWLPQMDAGAARARLPQVAQGGRRGRWTGSTTTTEGCSGAGLPRLRCAALRGQGIEGRESCPARPLAVVLGANQLRD